MSASLKQMFYFNKASVAAYSMTANKLLFLSRSVLLSDFPSHIDRALSACVCLSIHMCGFGP